MNAHRQCMLLAAVLTMAASAGAFELKDIRYRTEHAGNVVFSHTDHLQQKMIRNNCRACHQGEKKKIPHATMAQMDQGVSCGACHNGNKAFALNNCVSCHVIKEVKLRAGDLGSIIFSHKGHAAKQHCDSCHSKLYRIGKNQAVGMAAMKAGTSCGACHDAKIAFGLDNCTACHPAKDAVYQITGGGTVRFSHQFHLGLYQCRDCHTGKFSSAGRHLQETMAGMAKGKSCGACHDGKTAFTSQENCARCHTIT